MMKYFLSIDYALSLWFSKTKDKIIPGTAFLFLNKIVFLWISLFLAVTGVFKIKTLISIEVYVGISVFVGALIMYGFQKRLERVIEKLNLEKTFKLSKHDLVKKRVLGLFYFASSFFIIFVIATLFH